MPTRPPVVCPPFFLVAYCPQALPNTPKYFDARSYAGVQTNIRAPSLTSFQPKREGRSITRRRLFSVSQDSCFLRLSTSRFLSPTILLLHPHKTLLCFPPIGLLVPPAKTLLSPPQDHALPVQSTLRRLHRRNPMPNHSQDLERSSSPARWEQNPAPLPAHHCHKQKQWESGERLTNLPS